MKEKWYQDYPLMVSFCLGISEPPTMSFIHPLSLHPHSHYLNQKTIFVYNAWYAYILASKTKNYRFLINSKGPLSPPKPMKVWKKGPDSFGPSKAFIRHYHHYTYLGQIGHCLGSSGLLIWRLLSLHIHRGPLGNNKTWINSIVKNDTHPQSSTYIRPPKVQHVTIKIWEVNKVIRETL